MLADRCQLSLNLAAPTTDDENKAVRQFFTVFGALQCSNDGKSFSGIKDIF